MGLLDTLLGTKCTACGDRKGKEDFRGCARCGDPYCVNCTAGDEDSRVCTSCKVGAGGD